MANIYKEFFTDIIKEQYDQDPTFLKDIQDMSDFVDNSVINLAEAGIDPKVNIDSDISYPIPIASRADSPVGLPLSSAASESTVVRNLDELQTSYDKTASVLRRHSKAIMNKIAKVASYNYAPSIDGIFTPVLATTGADNGAGVKMLIEDDVLRLAEAFDRVDAPDGVRTLVLHDKQFRDLLRTSSILKEQQKYLQEKGVVEGEIYRMYGFKIHKYKTACVFNKTTGAKKAFNALATPSSDAIASVAYVETEVMKAMGNLEMFYRLRDPDQQGDVYNFLQRFACLTIRGKYLGAIYSA